MLHGGEAHFCAQERFSGAESGVLQKAGGPGAGERGHRRWAGGKLNQSGETSEGQCPKSFGKLRTRSAAAHQESGDQGRDTQSG